MDWSSILALATSGRLVFWTGLAGAIVSLALIAGSVSVLKKRLTARGKATSQRIAAPQLGNDAAPAPAPPDSVRVAAAYGLPATDNARARGRQVADSPETLLARLRHSSAQLERMVDELQLVE